MSSLFEKRFDLIYTSLNFMPKDICLIINNYASYPVVKFAEELHMRNYTKYVKSIFEDKAELTTLMPKDCIARRSTRKSTIDKRSNIIKYHIYDDAKYDAGTDDFYFVKTCLNDANYPIMKRSCNLFYIDEVENSELEDYILIK